MSLAYHQQQGHYVLVQICQIFFGEASNKPGLLLVHSVCTNLYALYVYSVILYALIFSIAKNTYTLARSHLHIHIFENYLLSFAYSHFWT